MISPILQSVMRPSLRSVMRSSTAGGTIVFIPEFIFTVNILADGDTFTIPTQNSGTFLCTIDWGDGSTSDITAYNDADLAHTYATAGDHMISISGQMGNIYFDGAGDKARIKHVHNLGLMGWAKLNGAFHGCAQMESFTVGTTDTSGVDNMSSMFRSCGHNSFKELDLSAFDTSAVTNMANMFFGAYSVVALDLTNFDTSLCTNMANMFRNMTDVVSVDVSSFTSEVLFTTALMFGFCDNLLELDVSGMTMALNKNMSSTFRGCDSLTSIIGVEDWDITSINGTGDLNSFISGGTGRMTTAQYDALLVKWDAQSVFAGMTPNFGTSTYTAGSAAATARANLIASDGWTITDGGTA